MFGIYGRQCKEKLYALNDRRDQKNSRDVVTSTLRVFDLNIYTFLDLGSTLSFGNPYRTGKFSVSLDTVLEPFSISTLVSDPIIARRYMETFLSHFLGKSPQQIL